MESDMLFVYEVEIVWLLCKAQEKYFRNASVTYYSFVSNNDTSV